MSVAEQDANNNTETGDNATTVTLAINNNPSAGVLTCTNTGGLTVTVASGVANFTGCAITKTGTGYTLTATSTPAHTAPANANAFNITAGAATNLTFTTQPAAGANVQATGTGTFNVSVAEQDANNNTETGDNATAVTLAINNNPSAGRPHLHQHRRPHRDGGLGRGQLHRVCHHQDRHRVHPQGQLEPGAHSPGQRQRLQHHRRRGQHHRRLVGLGAVGHGGGCLHQPPGRPGERRQRQPDLWCDGDLRAAGLGGLGHHRRRQHRDDQRQRPRHLGDPHGQHARRAPTTSRRRPPAPTRPPSRRPTTLARRPSSPSPPSRAAGSNNQATGTGTFNVSVAEQDANNNTETGDNATTVTLAINNNPSGGVLTCTNTGGLTVTVASGVANFTGCAITKTGTGYTLTATSTPAHTAPANANAFNITAGAASTTAVSSGSGQSATPGGCLHQPPRRPGERRQRQPDLWRDGDLRAAGFGRLGHHRLVATRR